MPSHPIRVFVGSQRLQMLHKVYISGHFGGRPSGAAGLRPLPVHESLGFANRHAPERHTTEGTNCWRRAPRSRRVGNWQATKLSADEIGFAQTIVLVQTDLCATPVCKRLKASQPGNRPSLLIQCRSFGPGASYAVTL